MSLSVSAVIPAFNRERFIGEAIESVLRQQRPVDEIVVVDDGSSDDTARVALSFAGVRVIRLPTSRGTAGARNAAIAAARGRYLAWLDSDDLWLSDHTATVLSLLERHPACVVAFASAEYFEGRSGRWPAPDVRADEPFDALHVAFKRTISTMSPSITRRDAVLAIDGFDERLRCSVDFDLFLRLALKGPFVCSHRVTTRYRWHGDQISAQPQAQQMAKYTARTNMMRALIAAGTADALPVLSRLLIDCLHHDMWAARARHDAPGLAHLIRLADEFPEEPRIMRPFAREGLAALRQYCELKGRDQRRAQTSASTPELFGRPRWLYRVAFSAQLRYQSSRWLRPRAEWVGHLMDAATAWGRLKGAMGQDQVPIQDEAIHQ